MTARRAHRCVGTRVRRVLAVLGAVALSACGGGGDGSAAAPGAAQPTVLAWAYPADTAPSNWDWGLPAGFAPPRVPADNPMNAAKVALGRHLFYDKRLSGPGTMSCASCHEQQLAFADGKARPSGVTGELHPRNSMALVNVAYNASQTWANPALTTLERQITNPVFGTTPIEMGVDEAAAVAVPQRLRAAPDVDYPTRFQAAFPEASGDPLTWEHILKAISAFQRTLISADSRYDRWRQGRATLTPSELNGWRVFNDAQCVQCHAGPNFSDQFVSAQTRSLQVRYHNLGLYNLDGRGAYPPENIGALDITGNPADMGAFRTPTLRNIEVTGPYMHDGSVATLEEAVEILTGGGRDIRSGPLAGDGRTNPHKSEWIRDRALPAQDKADLVAFMKTLTDEAFLTHPAFSDPFAGR